MTEKRKLRLIRNLEGKEIRTITTYRKFRKRITKEGVQNYIYSRKDKRYSETLEEIPEEIRVRRRKRKEPKEELIEIPEKRIRKQVVLNIRSDEEPYAVSVRAITINPEIEERGLKIAVMETLQEVDLRDWADNSQKTFGFEEAEIAPQEDRRLNDYRVHVEIQIKKNKPINFIK